MIPLGGKVNSVGKLYLTGVFLMISMYYFLGCENVIA